MRSPKIFTVIFLILAVPIAGTFFIFFIFIFSQERVIEIKPEPELNISSISEVVSIDGRDNKSQEPLANPPEIIKAVYLTSSSAGSEGRINYLINLASTTEVNAAVIDIKDFSGSIAYETAVLEVKKYKAESIKIADIDALIKKLHQKGIYMIARITVFQDPVLARARPELAIQSQSKLASSTDGTLSLATLWLDNFDLAWIDPSARDSWDYIVAIAKDAASHGFDEINFDYARFPTDGDLEDIIFPLWDGETPKNLIIRDFFQYLRQQLPETKISIDLFGQSTVNLDDLGVGQLVEDAFEYFDYVCPMVYPSHYAQGFLGYDNPNEHPYEVVKYSMEKALERLLVFKETRESKTKLRPWLQDFNLGVDYDAKMVGLEIKAVKEALGEDFSGFMLWSPLNIYTKGALEPVEENP